MRKIFFQIITLNFPLFCKIFSRLLWRNVIRHASFETMSVGNCKKTEVKDLNEGRRRNLLRSFVLLSWGQILQFWPYYLFSCLFLFITHSIQSELPFLVKSMADMVENPSEQKVGVADLLWIAVGIIVFRSFSRIFMFYPARVSEKNLRVKILRLLERVSPTRYQNYDDGAIFQILGKDVEEIRTFFGFAFLQIGNISIALFVLLPKLMSFDPRLAWGLLPLLPIFLIFSVVVGGNYKYYKKIQEHQGNTQNFIVESYNGKKTIKNFHVEKSFMNIFHRYSIKDIQLFYKAGLRTAFSIPLIPLGLGLSMICGASIIYYYEMEASSFILFSGIAFLFLEPLSYLSWMSVVSVRALGSWGRIHKFFDILEKPSEQEKHYWNCYYSNQKILSFKLNFWEKILSIDLERGKWSVFIGKTGDGKTHIMKQIAETLKVYGANISYVAQAPYLYNDTVEANIFLGKNVTEKMRDKAWYFLELFDLTILAGGRDELFALEVGENGKRLSGGQIKRLVLVRSLLSKADILLWDDPFSSIDIILERKIIQRIKKSDELANKTIVLTSHRLTTVRVSHRIIFLEKKEGIVENGLVGEVLKGDSKTYEYFAKQMV